MENIPPIIGIPLIILGFLLVMVFGALILKFLSWFFDWASDF